MSGKTKTAYAMAFEDARLDELDRGVIDTQGFGSAAAKDQNLGDAMGRQPRDAGEKIVPVLDETRGQMGNGLEA